jgi:transposase InsO family protein
LCLQAGVSTSGFYAWKKQSLQPIDEPALDIIKVIFESKKRKAGARTIKMILKRNFGIIMNLKKIRRIKKRYALETIIRRKNKYSTIFNSGVDHKTAPNLLRRKFNITKKDTVYSTDITYLPYGKGLRAYLSAVKDLGTKEIVHYNLSRKMTIELATNGLENLYGKLSLRKRKKLLIHSDQGTHYTSKVYRNLLKQFKVKQSMSRRGNCLDNAPIESFFGHMKDEIDLRNCKGYDDLELEIRRFINYYNNERPQWGLKGKTPAECRGLKF